MCKMIRSWMRLISRSGAVQIRKESCGIRVEFTLNSEKLFRSLTLSHDANGMEVTKVSRKKSLVLLSVIAMAMTIGGAAATYAATTGRAYVLKDVGDVFGAVAATYAAAGAEETSNASGRLFGLLPRTPGRGPRSGDWTEEDDVPRMGNWTDKDIEPRMGSEPDFVGVSEEFKTNSTNITENDSDVQKLLTDGYTITRVKPLINCEVDAKGNITTNVAGAVVMLQKDTTGRASVWIDLEKGKVTRIVITTTTVIDKS